MAESPVPPVYSWVADLMQRIPAYTLMAGLFLYYVLVVNPAREAWWWEQLNAREAGQHRALQEVEAGCYETVKDNRQMTVENRQRIKEIQETLREIAEKIRRLP